VYLSGTMGNYSKGLGKMAQKMVLEFGSRLKETPIKGNGTKIGSTGKAFSNIESALIKVSLKIF